MPVAAIPDTRFVDPCDYKKEADYLLSSLNEIPSLIRKRRHKHHDGVWPRCKKRNLSYRTSRVLPVVFRIGTNNTNNQPLKLYGYSNCNSAYFHERFGSRNGINRRRLQDTRRSRESRAKTRKGRHSNGKDFHYRARLSSSRRHRRLLPA